MRNPRGVLGWKAGFPTNAVARSGSEEVEASWVALGGLPQAPSVVDIYVLQN